MAKANLKAFTPDLPPSGRVIRSRRLERGDPKASRMVAIRLGARPDRRDFNPDRCLARSRGGEQCGRLPVRGFVVCPMHGAGSIVRQRNGTRLPPAVSGALGSIAREAKRGKLRLDAIHEFFPAYRAKRAEFEAHPELLDLQHDIVGLTALREVIVAGEIEADADFLLKALTSLTDTKANALRARYAIEMRTAVPIPVMREYVQKFAGLLGRYVPPERQGEMLAELRMMASRTSTDE